MVHRSIPRQKPPVLSWEARAIRIPCAGTPPTMGTLLRPSFRALSRSFCPLALVTARVSLNCGILSLEFGVRVSAGIRRISRTISTPSRPPEKRFPHGDAKIDGPLAQLAEQLTLNQRVRGSSPWRLTSKSRI
jgi:hypothetical protein